MRCPYCAAPEVQKHGTTRAKSARYICRKCKKTFAGEMPEKGCTVVNAMRGAMEDPVEGEPERVMRFREAFRKNPISFVKALEDRERRIEESQPEKSEKKVETVDDGKLMELLDELLLDYAERVK